METRAKFSGKYSKNANNADDDIKSEAEGITIAVQDQCLLTRMYQANILKDNCSPTIQVCKHTMTPMIMFSLCANFSCLQSISVDMLQQHNVFIVQLAKSPGRVP